MSELSPAAQAVLNAFRAVPDLRDCPSIAAALRAAVAEVRADRELKRHYAATMSEMLVLDKTSRHRHRTGEPMTMLTKNTDKLRQEVAAHVAADSIVQEIYWDTENNRGCFVGCLAHANDPTINEATYGLPVMVQRIAERIFESLPADDAKAFFAALPDAVACDGKDLTRVGWQFLAAELRSLPEQPAEIQAVIDPVIAGMDLLASGQEWPVARAAADAAADAAWAAWAARAADAVDAAARAAAWAAWAARAADAVDAADAVVRLRQRDLLLRLISEAPVVENTNDH